jgi:radical SAM protein with 4Fe4S-binding SPASM domain
MLYDGIVDVIEGASDLRLPVSIATNGTRIAASADRLVKAPLFLLQLSIDGPSADLHNRIRPSAGTGDNFKEINTALRRVNHARQSLGSNLPLIASLTVISRYNFRNLVDIYDTFRHKVDLFVFYLSWWIDSEQACSHEKDFKNRFGFLPRKHWGWVGDWKPDDYQMLAHQLEELRSRSRSWSAPPVTIIPPILGKGNLETYYTNHESRFGFDQCVSIYQAVEVNSNGDLSPCRDYHDFVVGNIKNATISQLWNAPEYRRFRKSLSTEGLMPVCSRCCGLMGY